MAIPDYQTCMLPFLEFISDEKEHSLRETVDHLANQFNLTDEERKEMLPSGQSAIFNNRIGWARTYLGKAGLLEGIKRGYFCITKRGLNVLEKKPEKITKNFLKQFDEFQAFLHKKKEVQEVTNDEDAISDKTPLEELEIAYNNLNANLIEEITENLKKCPPSLFEKIVVELLVKMGYGGSRKDAGKAIGKSGDEGIDGIIKEDRLGLDIIYIQAKRWENTVSRPEIQKFAGALQGQRAKKGIFITTSNFSKEAQEYVKRIDSKIILIDGDQLSQFMVDSNVGVSSVSVYEIKRVDQDYFTEE